MTTELRIVHLFPELLNLYADQGNIAVLRSRAEGRGLSFTVRQVKLGQPLHLENADLLILGGGSDREQAVVAREMQRYKEDMAQAVDAGLPLLAVCGGYQLLGKYYELQSGERIEGLGLVDLVTRAGNTRLIGNIAIHWKQDVEYSIGGGFASSSRLTNAHASGNRDESLPHTVVGFENHAGRTYHDYDPLGSVLKGGGNNGQDQREGLQYKGILGTYIHGPLLPKNPHIADHLLKMALAYQGMPAELPALNDQLEWHAHRHILSMLGISKGEVNDV